MISHYQFLGILLLALLSASSTYAGMVSCEASKKDISKMTKDNLFFTKTKPLVIGHRGNPILYQENTLDGYKSLLDLNVDGFETDIFLTKDKKLVLFHDVNTMTLTGEDHNIMEMTYAEIKKLDIKKQIKYGDRVYNYSKTEKIPLLEDLLKLMKGSGMLMILEMKPSDPPYNLKHSRQTGIEVARMVKRMGLEKQVVLSSFDPFKLYHAREELSGINTCFLFAKDYWKSERFLKGSKKDLEQLPGVKDCVKNVSDAEYGKFILETPALVKAIGASSLDMDYDIYNNAKYSNDSYEMFKTKSGKEFSYGAWTLYQMKFSEKELDDSEGKIQNLIDNGAGRLYVDDIPRLLKKLGRPLRRPASWVHYIFQIFSSPFSNHHLNDI
ncbi:uncharacterized protein LOC114523393 [Dendronephthya gigantea]|uniref:uncharacterized protein LOC114523393 n=1 Tax=Dendronephthya gigantea TaxID=151771 RepID=UPI00106A2CBA|nr:uncharacterized protein LOC114523393 [Dendronephthya gigantea]